MSAVYAVICAAALALIVLCCLLDKKKDYWLRLVFVAVFVCDLGYFLISVSDTLSGAVMGNRVVFLGSTFLPFLMLMEIMRLCRTPYRKQLPSVLVLLGILAFFSAAVPVTSRLYYVNIILERADGASRLVWEYGKLYVLYVFYYVVYSLSMLAVIIRAARAKRLSDPNQAGFLLCAVLVNLIVWLVERLIPNEFEVLTLTYLLSELFILFMHLALQRYDELAEISLGRDTPEVPAPPAQGLAEEPDNDEALLFTPEQAARLLETREELSALSAREKEVLRHILANEKRREIAEALVVTESTIKKHTSQIYKKLGVNNRIELYAKLQSMK